MPEAAYTPTPAEIRAECERIQAGWSERERDIRAGLMTSEDQTLPHWTPPAVRTGESRHELLMVAG